MADEIIPYLEMCRREGASLQRGMNFDHGRGYSVLLMSVRKGAPYRDRFDDDGITLVYEGHDAPRAQIDPKSVDQPAYTASGRETQNRKFYLAAQAYKDRVTGPHRVRVYEKIHQGIWSFNGVFELHDSWQETDGRRTVFKFKLVVASDADQGESRPAVLSHQRLIPTLVKIEVWNRDRGRCVICGAADELHFDHVLPFSKGGTSLTAQNVQLLCVRHNLQKGARIE